MIVLETQRLLLRQYKDGDITFLHSIFSDPETMRFIQPRLIFSKLKTGLKEIKIDTRMMVMDYGLFV